MMWIQKGSQTDHIIQFNDKIKVIRWYDLREKSFSWCQFKYISIKLLQWTLFSTSNNLDIKNVNSLRIIYKLLFKPRK